MQKVVAATAFVMPMMLLLFTSFALHIAKTHQGKFKWNEMKNLMRPNQKNVSSDEQASRLGESKRNVPESIWITYVNMWINDLHLCSFVRVILTHVVSMPFNKNNAKWDKKDEKKKNFWIFFEQKLSNYLTEKEQNDMEIFES